MTSDTSDESRFKTISSADSCQLTIWPGISMRGTMVRRRFGCSGTGSWWKRNIQAGQVFLVRLNEAQRDLIRAWSLLAQARVSLRQALEGLSVVTGEVLVGGGYGLIE